MNAKPTGHDPMIPIGTRMCLCTRCQKYFNSPSAFELHREDGACLDTRAMKRRGMSVNARGHWVAKGWSDGQGGRENILAT